MVTPPPFSPFCHDLPPEVPESWKRRESTLAYRWGTHDAEDTDRNRTRSAFTGEPRVGAYVGNYFVSLGDQVKRMEDAGASRTAINFYEASHTVPFYPRWRRRFKTGAAGSDVVALVLSLTLTPFPLHLGLSGF